MKVERRKGRRTRSVGEGEGKEKRKTKQMKEHQMEHVHDTTILRGTRRTFAL